MKKTIFLLMAIIAFLLPIGLTSCDTGDWEPSDPPKEMKLSVIKNDPVLKTFFADGNYPNKTLIASFNYLGGDSYFNGFTYGDRWENDSINEPDTPIYNIILNIYYLNPESSAYFKGRYNFTLDYRIKKTYSVISSLDGKTIIWKTAYYNPIVAYNNKTLLE